MPDPTNPDWQNIDNQTTLADVPLPPLPVCIFCSNFAITRDFYGFPVCNKHKVEPVPIWIIND
jgi:hypothetical protein